MNTKKLIMPLIILCILLFSNQIVNAQDDISNHLTEDEYNDLVYQIDELNYRVQLLTNDTTSDIQTLRSSIENIDAQLQMMSDENYVSSYELQNAIANAETAIQEVIETKIQALNNDFIGYMDSIEQNRGNIEMLNYELNALQDMVNSLNYVSNTELQIAINNAKSEITTLFDNKINKLTNDLDALSKQTSNNYEEYRGAIQMINYEITSINNIIESFDFVSRSEFEESIASLESELYICLNNTCNDLNAKIADVSNDVTEKYESLYNDILWLKDAYDLLDYVSTDKYETEIAALIEQLNSKLAEEIQRVEMKINELSSKTTNEYLVLSDEITLINERVTSLENLFNSLDHVTQNELRSSIENVEQKLLVTIQDKYTLLLGDLEKCNAKIGANSESINNILNSLSILEDTISSLDFISQVDLDSAIQYLRNDIDATLNDKVNELYEEIEKVSKKSITNYETNAGAIVAVFNEIETLKLVIESLDYVSEQDFHEHAIALREAAFNEFYDMIQQLDSEIDALSKKHTNNYEELVGEINYFNNTIDILESTVNSLDFIPREELELEIQTLRQELFNYLDDCYNTLDNRINELSKEFTANYEELIADIDYLNNAYSLLDYVSTDKYETSIAELTMDFYSALNEKASEIIGLIDELSKDNTGEHEQLIGKIDYIDGEVSTLSSIINSYEGVTSEYLNSEISKAVNDCQSKINVVKDELNDYFNELISELSDRLDTLSENSIANYETLYEEINYLDDKVDNLSNIIDSMDYVSTDELNEGLYDLQQTLQNIINEEINKINDEIAGLKQVDNDNLNECLTKFDTISTKIKMMEELIKKSDVVELDGLETQITETKEYLLSYIDEKILVIQDKINQQEEDYKSKFEEQKNINVDLENKIKDLETKSNDNSETTATTISVVSLCGVGGLSLAGLVRLLMKRKN